VCSATPERSSVGGGRDTTDFLSFPVSADEIAVGEINGEGTAPLHHTVEVGYRSAVWQRTVDNVDNLVLCTGEDKIFVSPELNTLKSRHGRSPFCSWHSLYHSL